MTKLSGNSKKYLEEKYGVKSEPISSQLEQKLKDAATNANDNIKRNHAVYNQSNAHSQETVVSYNSGIRTHCFYETNKEANLPERSEEELMEYKRLIGMPLTEDYDELINSLVTPSPEEKNLVLKKTMR